MTFKIVVEVFITAQEEELHELMQAAWKVLFENPRTHNKWKKGWGAEIQ
jgi:hypothetical protein